MAPHDTYLSLMLTIRERFDTIEKLENAASKPFSRAEAAAFHGRKIVEGIAFGCLVAVENGLTVVPRDARGQWNAESILKKLKSNGLSVLPSPSIIRQATPEEQREGNSNIVVDGVAERRLTHDGLIAIYQSLHAWLHEVNPYVHLEHSNFYAQKGETLWANLTKVRLFMERHFISINGAAFFCVLWDSQDGQTKIMSLDKESFS